MKLSIILSVLSATALAAPAADVLHPTRTTEANKAVSLLERALSGFGIAFDESFHKRQDDPQPTDRGPVLDPPEGVAEPEDPELPENDNPFPLMFLVSDQRGGRARVYTEADIQNAVEEAHHRRYTGNLTPPWGIRETRYPHEYRDHDHGVRNLPNIPSQGPFYEYPILPAFPDGTVHTYREGSPRADRVIIDGDGNFVTLLAHSMARNDPAMYAGHAAQYNENGDRLQLSDRNEYPGSNPWYEQQNIWGDIHRDLAFNIQWFHVRNGNGGSQKKA